MRDDLERAAKVALPGGNSPVDGFALLDEAIATVGNALSPPSTARAVGPEA